MAKLPEDGSLRRLGQPLRPGVAYYLVGAALAAALVSAAPFFWAPPFWLATLMARKPAPGGKGKATGTAKAEPGAPHIG